METHGQKIYGFYDGDFTFHMAEYDHDPSLNGKFRVRIDNANPEERACQNMKNPNGGAPNWSRIRPCTEAETAGWLHYFKPVYPLRQSAHTDALRHLRLHGTTSAHDLSTSLRGACRRLCEPILRVREFQDDAVPFVEQVDGVFQLTDEGLWLTGLMK